MTPAHTIKFSHAYPKLHGQTSAALLAVIPIRIDKDTPRELLEYDTKYIWYDGPVPKYGFFPLPTGDYIQLIFLGNLHIPFCTIRRAWPPQKVEYYKSAIGYDFEVIVKGEGK